MITKICKNCGKEFKVFPYRKDTANYCSIRCGKIGKNLGNTNGFKKGHKLNIGRIFSSETRLKMSLRKIGKAPWNKGIKYLAITGDKNPNWRGGITTEREKERKSIEYKLWRKAVYERDHYTCQMCGCKESGKLNAHHIKPFSLYPELKFAIDNGITLCTDCHKKTDSYMKSIKELEKLYLK